MTDERHLDLPAARRGGDGGAAVLEFAFISILLSMLVFGIIDFGLLLNFKQDVTRAAAEGARAAAVEYPAAGATAAAMTATDEAVSGFGKTCNQDGLTCTWYLHDCAKDVTDPSNLVNPGPPSDPNDPDCVQVRIVYSADDDPSPPIPSVPVIGQFLHHDIVATSDVRVNT
jgi:Flp pilus assembly protein TadG